MKGIINEIQLGIEAGDAQRVKEKITLALSQGITPETIMEKGLLLPMDSIGKRFRTGELFIPDVLMSSRAMHAGIYVLKPILNHGYSTSKGLILIGTVAGDLHDIGKNMVSMLLVSEGYTIIDLGIDVMASEFVDAIYEFKPDILALSALLTTTMGEQREVLNKLEEEGLRDCVKVIVGGGPVTKDFAIAIGADAFARDLFDAIDVINNLMLKKQTT